VDNGVAVAAIAGVGTPGVGGEVEVVLGSHLEMGKRVIRRYQCLDAGGVCNAAETLNASKIKSVAFSAAEVNGNVPGVSSVIGFVRLPPAHIQWRRRLARGGEYGALNDAAGHYAR
jgi:hypothetical protein